MYHFTLASEAAVVSLCYFSGPDLSHYRDAPCWCIQDRIGLPKGQETHLPALCLLWILDIFPFDLQGIHHLGGEAVLSPSVSVPSIFQVSLRIPFGEIRSRFTEELASISLSAPTGICNCIVAFIIFYLYCGCMPSVSFSTQ